MASISPTTSLATFQTSHASSSKLWPHVRLSEVRNSAQQLGVLTVQGDGIWTYDLSTPRPISTFTVPPSTLFGGPAVSFYPWVSQSDREKAKGRAGDADEDMEDEEAVSRERVTAVVISKGESVKESDEEKIIWAWRGEESEKQVISVDGPPIQHLIHLERQSGLLAIQSLARMTYIDVDFNTRVIASPLPFSKALIIAADYLNIKGDWRLIMIDWMARVIIGKLDFQTGQLEVLHDGSLCAGEVALANAEIDADGGVTAISSKNEIISVVYKDLRQTVSPPYPLLASPSSPALILPLPYHSKPIALIPSSSNSTIALAITSQESPVVLNTLPVLLGAENASSIIDIQILAGTSQYSWVVGFVVTHKHAQGDSGRSIVYITDVALPEKGIGLNMLMGSQERSARYFKSTAPPSAGGEEVEGLIRTIEKALAEIGGSDDARAAQAERLWSARPTDTRIPESKVKALVNIVFDAAFPKPTAASGEDPSGPTSPKRTGPYAQLIIADLLERRQLNDTMLPGGLISAGLLPCGHWVGPPPPSLYRVDMQDIIPRAIELLPTISSASVISCLIASLHPTPAPSPAPPAFDSLYAQVLRLPPPPPTWRVEMRQRVPVEDATMFLETLLGWAEGHVEAQASLETWDAPQKSESGSLIPPLSSVLQHASLLLDSHIALFLSHPPSHPALERLQAAITPLLEAQSDYRALRAPIGALLTLSDRATRDKEEVAARQEAQRPEERKRRQKSGGVAELRTAVIGKWRVEDLAF